MTAPLYVERDGHRTWLKWHRARRRASDPAFTPARILEAMQAGASVEVDLVVHRDHGFAILHDLSLDHATTGTGPVRAAGADALRRLHLRGPDGVPLAERVMLLEDLCALLSHNPPHADALLQLDFKETRASLDEQTVENFAASVRPFARSMILSSGDPAACACLSAAVPGLISGYDPTPSDPEAWPRAADAYAGFIAQALEHARAADTIYLAWQLVLDADRHGIDVIGHIHAAGCRVDAWTVQTVNPDTLAVVERLLALKVDQITTDDPEGLFAALTS